jgi:hypothetical protein
VETPEAASGMDVVIGNQGRVPASSTAGDKDASSAAKKQRTADEEWSKIKGPGAAFASMHEGFNAQEHLVTFSRECIVAMIFLYPIVVRQLGQANFCTSLRVGKGTGDLDETQRLVADWDVVCGSSIHEGILGASQAFRMFVGVGLPAFIFLLLIYLRNENFDLGWRRITQALFDGYMPGKAYWEVIMFLRTGLMIEAGQLQYLSSRCLLMFLLMSICMCGFIELRPYEARDRQVLHNVDLTGMMAIILTIVGGMVCQYEIDADLSAVWQFPESVKFAILVLIMLVNVGTVLYFLVALTFNTMSLQLRAVITTCSDLSVDSNSRLFDWMVRKTYRGMNPVGYFTRNGRHFIDVSALDESERSFLVLSLTETMSACFDSGSKIHTWLLENAIHEGFQRALEARRALMRNLYDTHGGNAFSILNLGFLKLCKVNVRPPDIATSMVAEQHGVPAAGMGKPHSTLKNADGKPATYSSFRLFKGAAAAPSGGAVNEKMQEDEQSSGVTVEELHNALNSVNVDVLERHPNIHRPMWHLKATEEVVQEIDDKEGKPDHYALTWNPGASLSVFEDYAKTWGSLTKNKKMRPEVERRQPDEELWQAMEAETEEFRGSSAFAMKERELEEQYAMMQEEVLTLRLMLQESEASAGNMPMLTSAGNMPMLTDAQENNSIDRSGSPPAEAPAEAPADVPESPAPDPGLTPEQWALLGEPRNASGGRKPVLI